MMTGGLLIVLILAVILLSLTARQIRQASRKRIKTDLYHEIQERINLLRVRTENEPEEEAWLDYLMICELKRALSRSKRNGGQL